MGKYLKVDLKYVQIHLKLKDIICIFEKLAYTMENLK